MKVYGAILAGGSGSRMKSDLPKQFLKLNGKEIILYTIEAFDTHELVDEITIVIPKDFHKMMDEILEQNIFNKKISITTGGETRQQSSSNALHFLDAEKNDIILLHDGARPFVSHRIISDCIEAAQEHGACSVYIPAVDTITEIQNNKVISIPLRENLYYTQTPQAFRYSIIVEAHKTSSSDKSTDDVSLLLEKQQNVYMVKGDSKNIKVTSPLDLKVAQVILEENQ